MSKPRRSTRSGAQQARAWAVAVDVVYYMLAAGLMGYAIDYKAGTSPRWMLILGGVGLVVGMYRFVKDALSLVQQDSKSRQSHRSNQPQSPADKPPKDPG